jgi:hypothetical protein
MPIAPGELKRDFVVVDEGASVRQARDLVEGTGNLWTYIVVRLESGQYAVLRLDELIDALKEQSDLLLPGMLDMPLSYLPGLLASRAGDAVERDSMSTWQAKARRDALPGKRLVVLAEGEVVGLLDTAWRSDARVDVDWLGRPADEETHVSMQPDETPISKGPSDAAKVLEAERREEPGPQPIAVQPEKRWINAEIEDHDPAEALHVGQVYTLAFDVDTEARTAAAHAYAVEADTRLVGEITVQLSSEDFEIYSGPQRLLVPPAGRSKNKARFDIEPRREGDGVINAVFLKDGNFIQLMSLTLGRPVNAVFVLEPRDLNLTILNMGTGFQVVMSGAVAATATLPLTLPHLDRIIADVRQELRDIVFTKVGPQETLIYQNQIDIPPEVNRAATRRLARIGFRLFQRIFYGPGTDTQANLLGDRLREMAQHDMLKIQIFSQQFMLPWGILYMADEYDPDAVNPEAFLGLKHIIEHIPLQQTMRVIDGRVASQPRLTVSLNVNADIDQQMGLPLIANQIDDWKKISQACGAQVVVRKTAGEVTQALADDATADQILYFYCHAVSRSLAEEGGPEESCLVLSDKGYLTLEDLNLAAPSRQSLPGAPLVFINACQSAELSPLFYDGFVPYFMAKGARGVIGTECDTPALFAAQWAKRFFYHFLTGKSLGQAFLDLRREFYFQHGNLLGLLYALYCDGDTHVVPGLNL